MSHGINKLCFVIGGTKINDTNLKIKDSHQFSNGNLMVLGVFGQDEWVL